MCKKSIEKIEVRRKVNEAYSHIDDDLILDFFIVFSRFEYVLKEAGYIPEGNNYAKVKWDDFIEEIEDDFSLGNLDHPSEMALFESFKTQRISNGVLKWRDFEIIENNSDAENVVNVVRTIRNNLFHGGKASEYCSGANKERDESLVEYALKIIDKLINSENDVRYHFYNTLS